MKLDVTTHDGYTLASALRGPDLAAGRNYSLKLLFTARIRTLVGIESDASMPFVRTYQVGVTLAENALQEAKDWVRTNRPGFAHYLIHIEQAAVSLSEGNLVSLARAFRLDTLDGISINTIIELGGGDASEE